MFVIQSPLYIVDRRVRYYCQFQPSQRKNAGLLTHATAFQDFEPFLSGLLSCYALNEVFERIPVLYAQSIGFESFVCRPFWLANLVAQHTMKAIITAPKEDVTVCCLKSFIWNDRCYETLVWLWEVVGAG